MLLVLRFRSQGRMQLFIGKFPVKQILHIPLIDATENEFNFHGNDDSVLSNICNKNIVGQNQYMLSLYQQSKHNLTVCAF